ncbi:MAG: hypothetical protein ABMA26_00130 [Limisphaerales bacterium]
MSLSEITQTVLRLVETRSGIPVHVEPDPSLPGTILARVVMARGALALHRVSYRPDSSAPPDYLICAQAGFILRLFDTPPDKRFDFAASPVGDAAVEHLVKAHPVGKALPPQALPQLCQILRDGLLNHLRSIPLGMRVDRWLATEFPALAELQQASVLRQLQDSITTLAPKHRQVSPPKIYDASQAISAAFAAFWAARLNQPQLVLPFKAAGYLQAGQELLAIWEATPDVAENDRAVIDAWADKLGVAGWYQWVPYSAPK